MKDWLELHQSALELASQRRSSVQSMSEAPVPEPGENHVGNAEQTQGQRVSKISLASTEALLVDTKDTIEPEDLAKLQQVVHSVSRSGTIKLAHSESDEVVRLLKYLEQVVIEVG